MKIGIPRETAEGEARVSATPETVKKLIGMGMELSVTAEAGLGSDIPDGAYIEAGAQLARSNEELFSSVDIIFCVQPPDDAAIASLGTGTTLIGMLAPLDHPERVAAFAKQGITALSLELLPRISRAQGMDVLSSQSNIAGYGAVLLAATTYKKLLPMMMTAAGTIVPAKALILGAGVAGLQAIATARRLGAVVSAYDVRPETKEQVESLGAKFIEVDAAREAGADTGTGYAGEMSAEYKARERQAMVDAVGKADLIVTTALIPGKPAPILIDDDMLEAMTPGAVIIDLAAAGGGNCSATEADRTVVRNGVTIVGPTNLPSRWAGDASHLFARNLVAFVEPMIDADTGDLGIDLEDEVVTACLLTRNGQVVHPRFIQEEAS